jgi:bacterioferritin
MDKGKIVELLNQDLEGEHGAIIQYLSNAYAMGEGEMACEIEAIAREEMRHLDWLAETIVELGGVPSLTRGTMRPGGETVSDWMGNDVLLEEGAIANYGEHIEAIDDPKVKRLLRRIKSDEEAHRLVFQHFIGKAREEGARDLRGTRADKLAETLNWGIEHEYTVVLQYLFHLLPGSRRGGEARLRGPGHQRDAPHGMAVRGDGGYRRDAEPGAHARRHVHRAHQYAAGGHRGGAGGLRRLREGRR